MKLSKDDYVSTLWYTGDDLFFSGTYFPILFVSEMKQKWQGSLYVLNMVANK